MNAFSQSGKTIAFTANTSAPTPLQASNYEPSSMSGQYRVCNAGNVTVFLGVGSSASDATANAVIASSSQNCLPLLPGTVEIVSFGFNSYFTGITSSGTAVIYVTPGSGI